MSGVSKGLTLEESNEMNRCNKEVEFFSITGNQAKIILYLPFKNEVDDLKINMAKVTDGIGGKIVDTKDITSGKLDLKIVFADAGELVCSEAHAYAIKFGKPIASATNILRDEFLKTKDTNVVGLANNLKTVISPYLVDMALKGYALVLGDLTGLVSKASAFAVTIGTAKAVAAVGTATGEEIAGFFEDIAKNQKQLELLRKHWKHSDNTFYKGIVAASVLDDIGHHWTGVKGVITKGPARIPVGNGAIKNLRNHHEAEPDLDGNYVMVGMVAHLDQYEISGEGCVTKLVNFKTNRGETLELDVNLDLV